MSGLPMVHGGLLNSLCAYQNSLQSAVAQQQTLGMISQLAAYQNVLAKPLTHGERIAYLRERHAADIERGLTIVARISFWSAFRALGWPMTHLLVRELGEISDKIERSLPAAGTNA